jgi:hypothetical protein
MKGMKYGYSREPLATHFLWRPQLRDPNDEIVLEVDVSG